MLIICYYCELSFREELYLKQHFIHNYACSIKRNKILLKINDKNHDKNHDKNYDKNHDINITCNQSKLNRLENRLKINKIKSDIINFPKDIENNINIICNETARRLSEILK
jgi:hypothetical protein